jgi:hypothetical protein
MVNLTLSIPAKTKARMDKHKHIKWSSAIRTIIERKLNDFEEAERIAKKSNLKMSDFDEISKKIDIAMAKHAEELLHGYNN